MELLFTVDEANATLPVLRPLAEQLVEAAQDISDATDLGRPDDLIEATARLTSAAKRITELGVVIKDARIGLCDFAADHNGQAAYLCWRLGEEVVSHWHPREAGYAGRQPL